MNGQQEEKMKAEEMFKNCGFEKNEENGEKIVFLGMYMPYAACAIHFHLVTKEVSFSLFDEDFRFTPYLFKAIAKQMAELGWIRLMWQSAASIKYDKNLDEKIFEPIHNTTTNYFYSFDSNFDSIGLCGVGSLSNDGIYIHQPQVGKSKFLKAGTKHK